MTIIVSMKDLVPREADRCRHYARQCVDCLNRLVECRRHSDSSMLQKLDHSLGTLMNQLWNRNASNLRLWRIIALSCSPTHTHTHTRTHSHTHAHTHTHTQENEVLVTQVQRLKRDLDASDRRADALAAQSALGSPRSSEAEARLKLVRGSILGLAKTIRQTCIHINGVYRYTVFKQGNYLKYRQIRCAYTVLANREMWNTRQKSVRKTGFSCTCLTSSRFHERASSKRATCRGEKFICMIALCFIP